MVLTSIPDRKINDVNLAFLNTLGYSLEEIIGKPSSEIGMFLNLEQQETEADHLRSNGRLTNVEMQVRRKDGMILDGLFSGEVIHSQGKDYFLTVMVDITERKRMELALVKSESLYRSILNASPDDITITDLDGCIQALSPVAVKMFGYEREEEMLGRKIGDFLESGDQERVKNNVMLLHYGISSGPSEYHALRADGSQITIEANADFIRGADGEPTSLIFVIRDITARKREEVENRENKDNLELIFNASPDATMISRLEDGVIINVNESFVSLTGYPRAEIVGKTTLDINIWKNPDDRQKLISALEREGYCKNVEAVFQRKNGSILIGMVFAQIVALQGDLHIISMTSDITERKLAEEALNKSETLYRLLAENVSDVIWILDINTGKFRYISPSVERMRGFSVEEVLAQEFNSAITQDSLQSLQQTLPGRIKSYQEGYRGFYVDEVKQPCKDGTVVWTETNTRFILNETDGHLDVYGVSRDITERKQAEDALRMSESKIRAITDSAQDAILMMDPKGQVSYWNPAAERIFGYTNSEAMGHDLHSLIVPQRYHEAQAAAFTAFLITGQGAAIGKSLEMEACRKDGSEIPIQLSLSSLFMNGEWYAVGIISDITERKQAEAALASEKQRLADIIEGTNVGTWEWNIQTGETIFNERWAEIIGYTLSELHPSSITTWLEHTHPDDKNVSSTLLEEHFRGELDYYECEIRMRHKNGNWVWVLDRGKVSAWTEDGRPLLMSGTHQDITVRSLAEQALRESQARYDQLAKQSGTIAWEVDPNGLYTYVSNVVESTLGYQPEELIGKMHFYDLHPEDEREDFKKAAFEIFARKGIIKDLESSGYTRAGDIIWMNTNGFPILDEYGDLIGFRGSDTDITERKLAEENSLKSEMKFRSLFEQAAVGVALIDARNGEFLEINQRFCGILGYKPDEMRGSDIQFDYPCGRRSKESG